MKREEMLKIALEKSPTLDEAKEALIWMEDFLSGGKPSQQQITPLEPPKKVKYDHAVVPKNNNKTWTEEDKKKLFQLREEGKGVEEIAIILHRKPNAILDAVYKIDTGRQLGEKLIERGGDKR